MPAASISYSASELDAVRIALNWARAGDVLAMPIHALDARAEVTALLDKLRATGWRPGEPLPSPGKEKKA